MEQKVRPPLRLGRTGSSSSVKGQLKIDDKPFAEGGSRLAFRAVVTYGSYEGFSEGSQVVVKAVKGDSFRKGVRLSHADIAAQELTRRYCERFNKITRLNKKVMALSGKLVRNERGIFGKDGTCFLPKGDTMLLESYMHGEYEKFNSNVGWSNEELTLPNFFSHWTWVESSGQHLVCDLQGHRGRPGGIPYRNSFYYYLFTDPAVMTNSEGGKYGCSDLGRKGIKKWFAKHTCNDLCKSHSLDTKRP